MKLGIVFPQADIGTDPAVIRAFGRSVEDAGFDYLLAYDHITGVHADRFAGSTIPGFAGPPYVHDSPFHEPLVLFSHLAGVTTHASLFERRPRHSGAAAARARDPDEAGPGGRALIRLHRRCHDLQEAERIRSQGEADAGPVRGHAVQRDRAAVSQRVLEPSR